MAYKLRLIGSLDNWTRLCAKRMRLLIGTIVATIQSDNRAHLREILFFLNRFHLYDTRTTLKLKNKIAMYITFISIYLPCDQFTLKLAPAQMRIVLTHDAHLVQSMFPFMSLQQSSRTRDTHVVLR